MKHSKSKSSRNKRPATHAPIRLTVLAGAFSKAPAHQDDYRTWSAVADEIEAMTRIERASKTELVAFNFARLREPYNVGANVEQVDALAIDVDRCDVGALLDAIKRRKVAALVYASPSDDASDPDARRVRVCAPVTRPIAPDEIKHVRMAFAESIGIGPGQGVEGALDPSRIFFVGRVEGTPERACVRTAGDPVDVDALLATPLRHEWARKATLAKRAAAAVDVPANADDPLVPLLWEEYAAGGRHELVRALAGWLAKNNAPDERIAAVVSALPSDRVPARVRTALETAAQARRDENTAGWEALKARVGDDAAPALETALGGCTWSPWWEAFTARRESRLARTAPVVDTTAWATVPDEPLVLDTTREGTPRPTIANTLAVLDHVFGERVRYDEMRGRIVCAGIDPSLGRFPDGLWTDVHTINLVAMCERDALRITTKIANEAIKSHARAHAFNPLRDWLVQAATRWDGRPRVDAALAVYWGAEDTPATRATSRVFLLSLAARGIEPGCKVDTCPIFIGAQGIYKSTALSVLAGGPDLFSDSPLPIGDKEALQNIRGKWLWEIGEHVSLTRRDANATKAFLSASHDTFRASYGHFTEDVPRTCVFVSTSNDTEVLRDTTGNRRLMPVRVTRIDVAGIERDREQLLGEAAYRVAVLDEPWWPTRDEERVLAEIAAEHTEHDAWEEVIAAWIERRDADGKGPFTLPEVFDPFSGAIPMPAERVDMRAQKRAAAALRALGYERRRAWERGANRGRWAWAPAGA